VLLPGAGPALAANPGTQGQPNQNCETIGVMPAGFGTAGFANAASVYAGTQPWNSVNSKSVSQYDVACFQVSQH
jgi:hypothetical protein